VAFGLPSLVSLSIASSPRSSSSSLIVLLAQHDAPFLKGEQTIFITTDYSLHPFQVMSDWTAGSAHLNNKANHDASLNLLRRGDFMGGRGGWRLAVYEHI
jgi:hypothetical protein